MNLTNIFPHLFNFLSFSLVVCWEACRVFDHSCTALCSKYASHIRFQKPIGYMGLVNLQKCYDCLWKLSLLLESLWVACIACFFREKKFSFNKADLRSHSRPLGVYQSYILTPVTSVALCNRFHRDFSWNKLSLFPDNVFGVPFNSLRRMLVTQFIVFLLIHVFTSFYCFILN